MTVSVWTICMVQLHTGESCSQIGCLSRASKLHQARSVGYSGSVDCIITVPVVPHAPVTVACIGELL